MTRILSISVLFCIAVLTAQNAAPGVYMAVDGRVVMQIESALLTNPGHWVEESDFPGYSGESYYIARNGVDGQNEENALAYTFYLEEAGDYWIALHNYIQNDVITENNDAHVRLDNGTWMKTWSHAFGQGHTWNWETGFSPGGEDLVRPVWENVAAGEHTVYIGSRSTDWGLDRIHIQKVDLSLIGDHYSEWYSRWDSEALFDTTLAESPKQGETSLRRLNMILTDHQNTVHSDNIYNLAGRRVSAFTGPFRIAAVKLGGK